VPVEFCTASTVTKALWVIYYFQHMPPTSQNPPEKVDKRAPSIPGSIGFGAMLVIWWILSIEIPRWNLFRIDNMRSLALTLSPITEWVYGVATLWAEYRWLGIILIIASAPFHYFLWKRRMGYDQWGKWLFKAGFMVFYVILYAFFLIMLLGAELPIYTNPANDIP